MVKILDAVRKQRFSCVVSITNGFTNFKFQSNVVLNRNFSNQSLWDQKKSQIKS